MQKTPGPSDLRTTSPFQETCSFHALHRFVVAISLGRIISTSDQVHWSMEKRLDCRWSADVFGWRRSSPSYYPATRQHLKSQLFGSEFLPRLLPIIIKLSQMLFRNSLRKVHISTVICASAGLLETITGDVA